MKRATGQKLKGNPRSATASGVIVTRTPKTEVMRPQEIGRGPLPSSKRYDNPRKQDESSSSNTDSNSYSSSNITADRDFVRGLVLLMSRPNRVWLVRQICALCGAQINIVDERTVRTDGQHLCAQCWYDLCGGGDTQVDIDIKQFEQDAATCKAKGLKGKGKKYGPEG